MRPGRNGPYLQPDSVRKTRTWYNNMHLAGSTYETDAVYARDDRKLQVTTSVTSGEWFTRFQLGLKLRTGQVCIQNEALTWKLYWRAVR